MNRRLLRDISASSTQVIVNQVLGLAIFFITSRYLGKNDYGEMNWSLALLTFITTILSLRLEQVIVRKVAAGEDPAKMLTLFMGHIFFTGTGFYLLLFAGSLVFPSFFDQHNMLIVLAVAHLLSFFSSPFKQLANGLERFRSLALMSSVSNIIRSVWLLLIVATGYLSIRDIFIIYIISSLAELLICFLIARKKLGVSFNTRYGWGDYIILIRESLPMAGAVILHASIARIDWILLGLFTTAAQTAEYSFAYKVNELSPLPLLIIAPVLLSRLSRFFGSNQEADLLAHRQAISAGIRIAMIIATGIPLAINLAWTPLMDGITEGKYGAVNETTFLILSICIPFLYINNFLWSLQLAQNRLRTILRVTFLTFLVILLGDLIFIPWYAATGAAVVYLVATIVEYFNYMRVSTVSVLPAIRYSPFICLLAAGVAGFAGFYAGESMAMRFVIAIPVFCLVLLATKQLRNSDWKKMISFSGTKK